MRPITRTLACLAALLVLVVAVLQAQADTPGNEHFQRRWARTDQPVADGTMARTWIWGPKANTGVLEEQYAEAPTGKRQVQYFDKSRMEITDPSGDPASPFYVTNGLLVIELMTGRMQLGDDTFEQRSPAQVNVAGDPDDPLTYADLAKLRAATPVADGSVITQSLDGDGQVGADPSLASYGVTAAYRVTVPGIDHQVASVFWDVLNATGPVVVDGQLVHERLFEPWFYATGYPVTEAYWANVKVGGTPRLVLLQCFERRCLTYTPGNPEGFEVEAGNVGQHYYRWRYETSGTPTTTATATATAPTTATMTTTSTATMTATATATATTTATATMTATVTQTPATKYEFDRQWGEPYTPIVSLDDPAGVAVDTDNNLWVVDFLNARLVQFDPDGRFLRTVGSSGQAPGEFIRPEGIAIDADGRIYVTDPGTNLVTVFDADGKYIRRWGGTGTGEGQFRGPYGIGVNDGLVFVVDLNNARIQVFEPDGTFLWQFGGPGTAPGQFTLPADVAFDAERNVYVTDIENQRVQKFTATGTYVSSFGSFGTGPGQFDGPRGIDIDRQGYIYVLNSYLNRIDVFTPNGVYHDVIGTEGRNIGQIHVPYWLALNTDGSIYVSEMEEDRIHKFSADGKFSFEVWDSRRGTFSVPTDIAYDEHGGLLVIDGHDDTPTISRYTVNGSLLETYGRNRPDLGQYDILRGVAVGSGGDIYVTDRYSNRVQRFSSTWVFKGKWGTTGSGAGQFNSATAIETDASGNVYVVDTGNNRVQKFDAAGSYLAQWGSAGSGNGQFKDPEGIAIHGDRVYVTDYGNNRVQVFTLGGEFIASWTGVNSTVGELKMPIGVEVRSDGYVLVVDYGNSRVVVFSPDGEAVDTFGKAGSGPGEFNVPFGIAIDDDGNAYVTDVGNHRVQKFALSR